MRLVDEIREEIAVIRDRDPAMHSDLEVFLYPSFRAMMSYRRAHRHYQKKHYFLARWISQRSARRTGIEIHPGAEIGKGFFIDHGTGVVIGETSIIGDNVTLYQGVTLGGTGKEQGKRHPTIGSNVLIGAGAKVLGSCTIGDNCKIGAGSVVLENIPSGSTVVGVPGRVVKQFMASSGARPQDTLDQVNFPDPVKTDIACLYRADSVLKSKLDALEKALAEEKEERARLEALMKAKESSHD